MNNLEWLKNNNDNLLKEVLRDGLAVNKKTGCVVSCFDIECDDCLFFSPKDGGYCETGREEWLNKEHESLYKRGDIVIFMSSRYDCKEVQVALVSEDNGDGTVLLTWSARNVERGNGIRVYADDIIRKVGNIYETIIGGII